MCFKQVSLFYNSDLAYAQFRRYTEYNHFNGPGSLGVSPLCVGDIFIDPPHRIVEVQGQSIILRPREFSLRLYFMRNPNIVLSSEQICDCAWGMPGSYNRGISQPIRISRQAIKTDPKHPKYIITVHRVGYRFIPNNVVTCEKCEDNVIEVLEKCENKMVNYPYL